MVGFGRLSLCLFAIVAVSTSNGFAQQCVNATPGPATSPGGYAVQGMNDCFMAADINAGLDAGLHINPRAGQNSDRDCSSPEDAMHVLRDCLENKGYARRGGGTSDSKPGFKQALCECNKRIFDQEFVCDSERFSDGVSGGDIDLLQDLVSNGCIVIAGLALYMPHPGGNWNEWTGHSVALVGASSGGGGNGPSITVRDGNNPDQTYDLNVSSDGLIHGDYEKLFSSKETRLTDVIIKCPASEGSSK